MSGNLFNDFQQKFSGFFFLNSQRPLLGIIIRVLIKSWQAAEKPATSLLGSSTFKQKCSSFCVAVANSVAYFYSVAYLLQKFNENPK